MPHRSRPALRSPSFPPLPGKRVCLPHPRAHSLFWWVAFFPWGPPQEVSPDRLGLWTEAEGLWPVRGTLCWGAPSVGGASTLARGAGCWQRPLPTLGPFPLLSSPFQALLHPLPPAATCSLGTRRLWFSERVVIFQRTQRSGQDASRPRAAGALPSPAQRTPRLLVLTPPVSRFLPGEHRCPRSNAHRGNSGAAL